MSGTLTFHGRNMAELGMKIGAVNAYSCAGNPSTGVTVPGRVGTVYEQTQIKIGGLYHPDYPVGLPDEIREYVAGLFMRKANEEDVAERMTEIRAQLLSWGVGTLRDSYEPQYFRTARFSADFTPVRKGTRNNFEVPLRFLCDPRRFIADVPDVTISSLSEMFIREDTRELARPLIMISGDSGEGGTANACEIEFQSLAPDSYTYGKLCFGSFVGNISFNADDLTVDETMAGKTYPGPILQDVEGDILLLPTGCRVVVTMMHPNITIRPRWWVR